MPQFIALGGYGTAGKDATADFLVEDHNFTKLCMSEPLEKALLTLDPIVNVNWGNWVQGTWPREKLQYVTYIKYKDLHQMVGYDVSKGCHDVRELLQKLGTDVGRKMFDEDVWVNIAFANVDSLLRNDQDVTLTGIRFENELVNVCHRQGLSIWVNRPGYGPINQHASENLLGPHDFDIVLDNDGTLEDLRKKVGDLPMICSSPVGP